MSSKKLTSSQRRPHRSQATVKEAALEVLRDLPSDCTWEQVMDRIYVRQKIEAGLKDVAEGRITDHEEVFAEFEQ